MIVKYRGADDPIMLMHHKEYEVLSIEKNWYRIIDEEQEDYLYPPTWFDIVDEKDGERDELTDKYPKGLTPEELASRLQETA